MHRLYKLFTTGLSLFLLCFVCQTAQAQLYIVTSVDSSFGDFTEKDLSRLFLDKRKELGGVLATPITMADESSQANEFRDKVLNKNTKQLHSYWSRLVFTGRGQKPIALRSEAEVLARVLRSPGAVGYVSRKPDSSKYKVLMRFE